MTPEQIHSATGCTPANAELYAAPITLAMAQYKINTPTRQAAFLAQIAHESSRLAVVVESTFYTRADQLLAMFPSHFLDISDAAKYVKSSAACANRIYANRMGNGNESSGDGNFFRGRGLIQITGLDNYRVCSIGIFGYPSKLLGEPTLLQQPGYAALSAAWFWSAHGLNERADAGDFQGITRTINGGMNGYADRLALLKTAQEALA